MVRRIVREGLTVGEKTFHNLIEGKGKAAGLSTAEIEPQLKQAALGESQKNLVGELMPYALKEWGMNPEVSPTAAIAIILGPWATASSSALMTLTKLAKEKAEREKKALANNRNPNESADNAAMGS